MSGLHSAVFVRDMSLYPRSPSADMRIRQLRCHQVLRLQRREVGGRGQHVFLADVGNDVGHERSPSPVPVATLHVIKLPHKVARRAPRKRWDRAESAQVTAVAIVHAVTLLPSAVIPFITKASPFLRLPGGT